MFIWKKFVFGHVQNFLTSSFIFNQNNSKSKETSINALSNLISYGNLTDSLVHSLVIHRVMNTGFVVGIY